MHLNISEVVFGSVVGAAVLMMCAIIVVAIACFKR
jgi:hypothetical protein